MQLISSDTSVWIDFQEIEALDAPFLLNDVYSFLMSGDVMDAELLYPSDLKDTLQCFGLIRTELSEEEYILALEYRKKYKQLSSYDAFALAIAKNRGIILLTGDKVLRNAAEKEGVIFHGTLWVIDRLWELSRIDSARYREMLLALKANCGKTIRLPLNEIEKRL